MLFFNKKILNFSIVNADSFYFSGGHVGHLLIEWYPERGVGLKNLSYSRANFIFFNLNKTVFFLNKACVFIKQMSKRGVVPLYVGNTKYSSAVVKSAGMFANINFIVDSWIGGLLTNFKNVVHLPLKKNKVNNKKHLFGLKRLDFVPELVLCSSEFYAPFAVSESNTLLLPTIGVVDSNVRVVESTYPVVLNDDSALVFKNLFFFFSSSFWFGRADFAMSYLSIMHRCILSVICSNNLNLVKFNFNSVKKFQKWLIFTSENKNLIISPEIKIILRLFDSI